MELVDLFRRVLSRGHRREAVLHVKPESRDLPAPASEKKRALSEAQRRTLLDVQRLLEEDRFLPRSAWASFLPFLQKLSGTLRHCPDPEALLAGAGIRADMLDMLKNPEQAVQERNERYIRSAMEKKKDLLDHLLDDLDPGIVLDQDQREVVLADEDYTLVVAGAGAGKTTTVAAKIAYLCRFCGVAPERILVVTFTRMAVEELRERVNRQLHLPCPIATFHSTGNAILRKQDPTPRKVVDDGCLFFTVRDYFLNQMMSRPEIAKKVVLFFGMYLDGPLQADDPETLRREFAQLNLSTLRSELNGYTREILDRRSGRKVTLQSEVLRSRQEVEIANTLYLNGLDYQYEPLYPYAIKGAMKPYTPDFLIRQGEHSVYLEHFGVSEDGKNDRMSEDALKRYRDQANRKVLLHREHGTEMIYTYSSYRDGRPLWEHLQEQLTAHGLVLSPRDPAEVISGIIRQENSRYARKMLNLICDFIRNFKTNGYTEEDFERMHRETDNVRTRLFLEICRACYLEYERVLSERESVDYQDMINESVHVLEDVRNLKQPLDFDYIIVDEYQDISRQRCDLVKAMAGVTGAKIMAVGDDWQSIYAFSGSDISQFTHFREIMGYARIMRIENTYRNAQEIIDVAGGFVQKNPEQMRKTLHSYKHIQDPIVILTYDPARKDQTTDWRSGQANATARCVQNALEQIRWYAQQDGKPYGQILLLGRFGFDGKQLENSGLFEYRGHSLKSVKYPDMDITYMNAHSSKGLGYDNVIIINGKNAVYGFPSKIEADPVMSLVTHVDRSMEYAEERRLFYVALTRTKNRVYIAAPQSAPSEFLMEIRAAFPERIRMIGLWQENGVVPVSPRACPVCGYPLQMRYNEAYGLRLYMCTNEPELCDFMTNDLRGGPNSIRKCDACRDGYLLVRVARGRPFLGCTEWRQDGRGCRRTVSLELEPEPVRDAAPEPEKKPVQPGPKKRREKSLPPPEVRQAKVIPECILKSVTWRGTELNALVHAMLQAVSDISWTRFYSRQVLLDVLRGSRSPVIRRDLLDQLPCFGSLAGVSREVLELVTDWLVEHHYLTVGARPGCALHLTYDAFHYDQKMTAGLLRALARRLDHMAA